MAEEEVLQSPAEQLLEYQQQLEQVESLLLEDPENEELAAIFDNLTEARGTGRPAGLPSAACQLRGAPERARRRPPAVRLTHRLRRSPLGHRAVAAGHPAHARAVSSPGP